MFGPAEHFNTSEAVAGCQVMQRSLAFFFESFLPSVLRVLLGNFPEIEKNQTPK